MKKAEVFEVLKSLEWRVQTNEVHEKYALFYLPDRIVDVFPDLRNIYDEQKFALMTSLSTEKFCKYCRVVGDRDDNYTPLVILDKSLRLSVPELLFDHVRELANDALAWANDQDLDDAIRRHAALPTNAPGARPVWHLAALAILGEVDKLVSYETSFEAGNRLGFVNYITKDYITRAVKLAKESHVVK